jgi:hypothetical protein
MAYQKQTWQDNDVITKAKLDHIEDGIVQAEKVPTVGDATTGAKGIVKMAAKVDAVSAANATEAEGQYTQATIQKIVTLANGNKTAINAILTTLKNAGIMSNS